MSPARTLRSGRRRSKNEKPKVAPESPQNPRRKQIVVNTRPGVPSQESLGKQEVLDGRVQNLRSFMLTVR